MTKTHDFSYEKKLLDLLGFKIKETEGNENTFGIYDENDKIVGFIRYKRINKGENKSFGYEMYMNNSKIKYHDIRDEKDRKTNYKFTIKDETSTKVELDLGKDKVLTIWSTAGFSNLNLNNRQLFLNLKSTTENYNTEESFIYSNKKRKTFQYSYQIEFSHKEDKKDKGIMEVDAYEIDPKHIRITDIVKLYGHVTRANSTEVEGTINDMVKKYYFGKDLFSHYHYLVDKILPFEKDIFEEIFTDEVITDNGLELFLSMKNNKENRNKAIITSKDHSKLFQK